MCRKKSLGGWRWPLFLLEEYRNIVICHPYLSSFSLSSSFYPVFLVPPPSSSPSLPSTIPAIAECQALIWARAVAVNKAEILSI